MVTLNLQALVYLPLCRLSLETVVVIGGIAVIATATATVVDVAIDIFIVCSDDFFKSLGQYIKTIFLPR